MSIEDLNNINPPSAESFLLNTYLNKNMSSGDLQKLYIKSIENHNEKVKTIYSKSLDKIREWIKETSKKENEYEMLKLMKLRTEQLQELTDTYIKKKITLPV